MWSQNFILRAFLLFTLMGLYLAQAAGGLLGQGNILLAQDQRPSPSAAILEEKAKLVLKDGSVSYELAAGELGLRIEEIVPDSQIYYLHCLDHLKLNRQILELARKLRVEPEDARLVYSSAAGWQVREEKVGRELDGGQLFVTLGNPGPWQKVYDLPFRELHPKLKKEGLKAQEPKKLWAQYRTTFIDNRDRTENIRVASNALHDLVIEPGQRVSFNEVVGPRTKERGYQEAKVIVGGRFENGLGGGICQVSSTLYNTILLAGLEINERHNHSVRIAYVPLGRDAAVVYEEKDFVFTNNTAHYFLLKAHIEGFDLTFSLWGPEIEEPPHVKLETKILRTIPHREIFRTTANLAPEQRKVLEKGQAGYVVEAYRILKKGEMENRQFLARDYYAPIHTVVAVGGQ